MGLPKINCFYSNSNYFSLDGNNENLSLLGGECRLGNFGTISMGAGADRKIDLSNLNPDDVADSYKMSPAFELKYRTPQFNLGNNWSLNGQLRFREMYGLEQYRVVGGVKYKIDGNNSLYSSIHYTVKSDGSQNAGAWVGWSHGKRDDEVQVNLDGSISWNHIVKLGF